jgi:hypothetical protein
MAKVRPNPNITIALAVGAPLIAPAVGAPLKGIDYLLDVVGFHDLAERVQLMEAGLANYEDFRYLVKKDIMRDMAEEFSKRMAANGHMTFGLGRTKKLTGPIHWIQDRFHCNDTPDHTVLMKMLLRSAELRPDS